MKRYFTFLLLMTILFSACDIKIGKKLSNNSNSKNTLDISIDKEEEEKIKWYAYTSSTFELAEKTDKLLLINMSSTTCYWCNVMEQETFQDEKVVQYINENFIPVRINSDERPDLAEIYASACELRNKSLFCNLPINSLALPDGRPFWSASYMESDPWIDALGFFQKKYAKDKDNMTIVAQQMSDNIQSVDLDVHKGEKFRFKKDGVHFIARQLLNATDLEKGGVKGENKHPMVHTYEFLMHYYYLTENRQTLGAINTTLNNMADRGMRDHIGGGFSSYAQDEDWMIPSFEKTLNTNGQLANLYTEGYQLTKNEKYKTIAKETLTFIERELMAENGGFYNGVGVKNPIDGNYFLWTRKKVEEVLKYPELADIFCMYYDITEEGDWNGYNVLIPTKNKKAVKDKYSLNEKELQEIITTSNNSIMKVRQENDLTLLDSKIITAWNAIVLKAFVNAYRTFGDAHYLDIAVKNATFIRKSMKKKNGRLTHVFSKKKSTTNGVLDDYALTIDAFINLYQATFDEKWLHEAKSLAEYAVTNFYDEETEMFYYTSRHDDPLIVRKLDIYDKAMPSSNSMMAKGLYLLGAYFYEGNYEHKARRMLANIVPTIGRVGNPNYFANWGTLYNYLTHDPFEIVILGEDHQVLRAEVDQKFLPNVLLAGGENEGSLEFLQGKMVEGETMIYVCRNKVCKMPLTEMKEALELITRD